ncbi:MULTISPECIES: glutamate racemase [unclassified Pseudomonas]|uniref:glutamate racemase n=1 Tax=unclassified Pseudomonas TaxID=196821 RepID=UPI000BD68AC7|nr:MULTISPECIES: glutamate racemase [unclassified Pseudomonas]PVZ15944.1 glutamate racemase [Pseudomonas sp. URIL14HWK12:I12]PVZ26200.1 glutamate racemase [Pseudomonas sp. URIL14HWK12:I10]PVZ36276.1 glutamate racemase [Pseudomonas sp. URIL14HWK12:I11]SNZ18315.1 glutamate racemase [Pseudomonas sp. URIL14HWK12:I9]
MPEVDAPIGVFDSGVGGLSVLHELRALLPGENWLYVADGGHCPYGEKSPDYIRQRMARVAEFLRAQGAKALVIACNTATVAACADVRTRYPGWPVVAMEPAVKPAAKATRNGRVGVLATTGTLQSARFAALLDQFASDVKVFTQPCPGLVELIETGDLHSPALCGLLLGYLAPLLEAGCDTLILGCTHYPFLRPLLATLLPPEVVLIDTGAAVARQAQRLLSRHGLLNDSLEGSVRYWTSADPQRLAAVLPGLGCTESSVGLLPV